MISMHSAPFSQRPTIAQSQLPDEQSSSGNDEQAGPERTEPTVGHHGRAECRGLAGRVGRAEIQECPVRRVELGRLGADRPTGHAAQLPGVRLRGRVDLTGLA